MSKNIAMIFSALLMVLAPHLALADPLTTAQGAHASKTRVVIQVSDDDPKKWNLALNNAKNLQKDLGAKNVEIEIVAYGPGIGIFKSGAETSARVQEAKTDGIQLSACENTMAAQKLRKEDMNPAVGYVPSGVVQIVQREQAGYAYLRP